ncbi:metalloregulator ArsR/SmtB family transcription factor [Metabacillus sp. GX 13764]|uniref:ArsR/SmtB family transcription factor n=1 Tax=Metabacillus kandeliae TaxID=2900151 RepID=UPI001E517A1F|nr:metalloregulator ArsR/SmtB family transcription factor [Metabacillus kandeliae]MCD7035246.1 metalloregulator ArsR/SmtB family transcription factor [Metabacillus kandeliae]
MEQGDVCEVSCKHEETIDRVKEKLSGADMDSVSAVFKALADPTRLKIAYALSVEKELCVCDAAEIAESSTATASHHLRHLKALGIADFRKAGKLVYYSLTDQGIKQLLQLAFRGEAKEGV